MFNPREYKPTEDEIIYYYCNADTFLSICSKKKLWLSDIFSMNDFLEMHWGYSIWEKAASELLEEYGKEFLDNIDEIIHESGIRGSLLALCFSLEGDILSQWRAYANDGKGYAIGFNAKTLSQLQIRPLKVFYDEAEQVKELKNFIRAIHDVEQSCAEKYGEDFDITCMGLSFDLVAYKNPAFAEEKEIRIVHLLNFQRSNDFLKLIDIGGNSFGKDVKGEEIKFRIKDGCPVPYIEIDFTNESKINPIKEVIIGPKNDVRVTAISVFLETNNVENVKVRKSNASYR